MASFKIFLQEKDKVSKDIEVTPQTSVDMIRKNFNLKGLTCRFKKQLNNAQTMEEIGIKPGETIAVYKTGLDGKRQAELRIGKGTTKKSKYNHVQLHKQTQEVVINESNRVTTQINRLTEAIEQKTRPAPGEGQRVKELNDESTSVLNGVLSHIGHKCKGKKGDKALYLAIVVRISRTQRF